MSLLARRVQSFATTVFSEFSALAQQHGAVNLGQGFPDFDGPAEVAEAAIQAIRDGVNQYAVGAGAAVLREAIAEHSERFYGMSVDPSTMVTVTSGATEALFDSILGLVDPGDEVIVFEPAYDSYVASIEMAGGIAKGVLLRPPNASETTWWFDADELEAQFSERTKLLILNTPHNPTGKVFSLGELETISALCDKYDVLVLADEVYEHLVFAPATHVRIATLPGMSERTLTISSGGKSFGFTGWKVGWAIGAEALRAAAQRTHQFVTFATAAPLQVAIARALRMTDEYFEAFARSYKEKRNHLVQSLEMAGLNPYVTEGTYFALVDIRRYGFEDDVAFCRALTKDVKVAAIPTSAFYLPEHRDQGRTLARFAFCKKEETLELARQRLLNGKTPLGPRC